MRRFALGAASLAACFATVYSSVGSVSAADRGSSRSAYTIAFASFAPLDTDIYIARGNGSAKKPFVVGGSLDYNPSVSADGKWVIFTSERAGSADIYRIAPDGSGLRKLVSGPAFDDQGALSPDGAKLAFVSDRSGQAEVWVLDLRTKTLTNVSQHKAGDFRPAWSPDGQWLAFSSDRESPGKKFAFVTLHSTAIYAVRADGSQLRRLTPAGEFAGSPSWSADGRRILFYQCDLANVNNVTSPRRLRGTTQIAAVEVSTGRIETLTSGPGEKWSPKWLGDDKLAYVSGGPDGGVEFPGSNQGPRGAIRSPSWSADGTVMVFHRETNGEWPPLQTWKSPEARFELLRTGIFASHVNSELMVLNDRTAGNLHNNVIARRITGGGWIIFHDDTRSALAPAVSPDRKSIAFGLGGFFQAVNGKAKADIAVVDIDGRNLTLLTDGLGNYGLPAWAPDGRQIVYRAAGGDADGLYVLDVATRRARKIPGTTSKDNFPSWSPDGGRISFTSNRDGDYEIYTIRPDGSDLTRLTRNTGNDAHNQWSPDGKWIVFTSAKGGFKDEAVLHPYNPQPYGDLYAMRPDGTDVRRLTNNQYEEGTPTWAPQRQ